MTERFKKRCDQLHVMGLRFNGQEYIGKDNYKDVNVHWTEISTVPDEDWSVLMIQLKCVISERTNA